MGGLLQGKGALVVKMKRSLGGLQDMGFQPREGLLRSKYVSN